MSDDNKAILVDQLRKKYGQVTAVDGISFQVEIGKIFLK